MKLTAPELDIIWTRMRFSSVFGVVLVFKDGKTASTTGCMDFEWAEID